MANSCISLILCSWVPAAHDLLCDRQGLGLELILRGRPAKDTRKLKACFNLCGGYILPFLTAVGASLILRPKMSGNVK